MSTYEHKVASVMEASATALKKYLDMTEPSVVPNTPQVLPYALTADDAFSLKTQHHETFSQVQFECERVFNYRLSHAKYLDKNAIDICRVNFECLSCP